MADERNTENIAAPRGMVSEDISGIRTAIAEIRQALKDHFIADEKHVAMTERIETCLDLMLHGDETESKPGFSKRLDRLEGNMKKILTSWGVLWAALIAAGGSQLYRIVVDALTHGPAK